MLEGGLVVGGVVVMKGMNNLSAGFSRDKYKYRSQDLVVNGEVEGWSAA